jgi:NAD(P)-dependent dehydrogenase (short-subunit alcohol dehydrogenase family)
VARVTAALVTGGSRGIGAATVLALTERGIDVAFTYRSRRRRADQVVAAATARGGRVLAIESDLTDAGATERMLDQVWAWAGELDLVVLNASGGLEQDLLQADPDYPMRINRDAQLALVTGALPLLTAGATIVLVTSHWAHLYGRVAQLPAYAPVAESKHAGEVALRELLAGSSTVRLVVVTGDLVEGTVTPKLLERATRGMANQRRGQIGDLPTVADMAEAIAGAALDQRLASGHTVVVGGNLEALGASGSALGDGGGGGQGVAAPPRT